MITKKQAAIRIGAAIMLTMGGCTTYALEELRSTSPVESPFHQALAAQYLAFAEAEAADYDWGDSQHFAQKGLRAAYGNGILPEKAEQWKLPSSVKKEARNAREKLIGLLSAEVISAWPDAAADAIFHYDCWMEEQEENWQQDAINRCRDGFYRALDMLGGSVTGQSNRIPKGQKTVRQNKTDKTIMKALPMQKTAESATQPKPDSASTNPKNTSSTQPHKHTKPVPTSPSPNNNSPRPLIGMPKDIGGSSFSAGQ